MARWHDGDKWTEHTLVIADQTPGVEPAPPVITPTVDPRMVEPEFQIPRHGASGGGRLATVPTWAKVGGPIAVVALIILAFVLTSSGGDKGGDKTATVGTEAATLDDAIAAARDSGLSNDVSDARAGALIERICNAATHPSQVDQLGQDLGQLPAASLTEVRRNVTALGDGATTQCRSTIGSHPDLINQLEDQAAIAFSTTTTAPTVPAGTGGTDAGATTAGTGSSTTVKGGKTTTTVKGAKTTTTKATTTTTAKPLPQVLPNQACSPAGAKGQNKITHAPLTCQKACYGSKLVWSASTCATTPTAPPTSAPSPTDPSITTTTTAGTTDAGTTGGL